MLLSVSREKRLKNKLFEAYKIGFLTKEQWLGFERFNEFTLQAKISSRIHRWILFFKRKISLLSSTKKMSLETSKFKNPRSFFVIA